MSQRHVYRPSHSPSLGGALLKLGGAVALAVAKKVILDRLNKPKPGNQGGQTPTHRDDRDRGAGSAVPA